MVEDEPQITEQEREELGELQQRLQQERELYNQPEERDHFQWFDYGANKRATHVRGRYHGTAQGSANPAFANRRRGAWYAESGAEPLEQWRPEIATFWSWYDTRPDFVEVHPTSWSITRGRLGTVAVFHELSEAPPKNWREWGLNNNPFLCTEERRERAEWDTHTHGSIYESDHASRAPPREPARQGAGRR